MRPASFRQGRTMLTCGGVRRPAAFIRERFFNQVRLGGLAMLRSTTLVFLMGPATGGARWFRLKARNRTAQGNALGNLPTRGGKP